LAVAAGVELLREPARGRLSGEQAPEQLALVVEPRKSHSVTAAVEIPDEGAGGVVAAQGGSMGGWSLYAHEGRLR